MLPVTVLFGPSASYNLLSILTPGLMCYAMYRLARLWLPTQTGAIFAGAFFGLSSIMAWHAWYQLNLAAGAVFLPLALEAVVRLRASGQGREAGGDPRRGAGRQPAHRPGIVRPGADRGAGGPGAVAVQPRLAGAADRGRERRRGVPGGGQPADRGHGGADPLGRRHRPGRHGGHRLRVLRHRVPRHLRRLAPRGPAGPDMAEADQLPRPRARRRAHVRPGAVGAGRARAGGLLAAPQRLAARRALARQRRAGAGLGAEDRHAHLHAVRPGLARRPPVRDHAVHLVRADPRNGRVPRSRTAHHARGAARRAAGRRRGRLAAPPRRACC